MESAKRRCSQTQTFHEFFKVFMPDTASTHLRLPKAFTNFFNGITPTRATLVDQFGNNWKIVLEKINDGLVLTNGWKQFVSDKSLEEADFLVFEYDGDTTTFSVKIFSKSGIIKKEPASGRKQHDVPIVILDEDQDPGQSCRKIQRGLKRKHSPTTLKINEKSNLVGTRGLSKRAYEANGNDYEKKVLVKHVTLKNPDFVIPYSRWRTARMEIPKSAMKKMNVKLTSKISMRDENGKVWPVTIIFTKIWGRTFMADGWSDFRIAKNIQDGQLCSFKFASIGKDNVAQELLVSVSAPSK